jgi:hypothetical protein
MTFLQRAGFAQRACEARMHTRACVPVVPQIPGVPIMYLQSHRYTIERLPEATLGGAPRS